jgi:hypothetical protein
LGCGGRCDGEESWWAPSYFIYTLDEGVAATFRLPYVMSRPIAPLRGGRTNGNNRGLSPCFGIGLVCYSVAAVQTQEITSFAYRLGHVIGGVDSVGAWSLGTLNLSLMLQLTRALASREKWLSYFSHLDLLGLIQLVEAYFGRAWASQVAQRVEMESLGPASDPALHCHAWE